jgi:hypothetical protein
VTNAEFRVWLKGYFELADADTPLNPQQAQVIINHLNLAEAVEGKLDAQNDNIRNRLRGFVQNNTDAAEVTAWLQGALT